MNGWRASPSHRAWLEAEAQGLLAFARGARLPRGFGWLGTAGHGRASPMSSPWACCWASRGAPNSATTVWPP
jgi:hypothetical protein